MGSRSACPPLVVSFSFERQMERELVSPFGYMLPREAA